VEVPLLARMDSLIAKAKAVVPVKKGKSGSKSRLKPKSASSAQPDATLASIAAHTRIPKSLSNTLDGDVREKKRAAKKGKYGHINDLKLRAHLSQMEEGRKDRTDRMEDVQMLNVGEAGGMEAEGVLERTWKMTQQEIVESVGMEDARSRADWRLDGGPYACRYSRNGRYALLHPNFIVFT
jgi:U3 small nucleolar RNA-associated protein 7